VVAARNASIAATGSCAFAWRSAISAATPGASSRPGRVEQRHRLVAAGQQLRAAHVTRRRRAIRDLAEVRIAQQRAQQRGLAGVGVADDRDRRDRGALHGCTPAASRHRFAAHARACHELAPVGESSGGRFDAAGLEPIELCEHEVHRCGHGRDDLLHRALDAPIRRARGTHDHGERRDGALAAQPIDQRAAAVDRVDPRRASSS
jgi:hypothetical protein